jgi:hypothetical protein
MTKAIRWTPQQLADFNAKKSESRPSKFGNKKVELDGEKFDSKAEANRYLQLVTMQRTGLISGLRRQVPFELAPSVKFNGATRATPALRYIADFVYQQDGKTVIEDCKGFKTEGYRVKRHLMKALLGLDILETK